MTEVTLPTENMCWILLIDKKTGTRLDQESDISGQLAGLSNNKGNFSVVIGIPGCQWNLPLYYHFFCPLFNAKLLGLTILFY